MLNYRDLEWRVNKENYPLSLSFEEVKGVRVAYFEFGVPYAPFAGEVTCSPNLLVIKKTCFCVKHFTKEEEAELIQEVNYSRFRALSNISFKFGSYVDSESIGPICELARRYGDII